MITIPASPPVTRCARCKLCGAYRALFLSLLLGIDIARADTTHTRIRAPTVIIAIIDLTECSLTSDRGKNYDGSSDSECISMRNIARGFTSRLLFSAFLRDACRSFFSDSDLTPCTVIISVSRQTHLFQFLRRDPPVNNNYQFRRNERSPCHVLLGCRKRLGLTQLLDDA